MRNRKVGYRYPFFWWLVVLVGDAVSAGFVEPVVLRSPSGFHQDFHIQFCLVSKRSVKAGPTSGRRMAVRKRPLRLSWAVE